MRIFLSRKPDDPAALLALADIAASEKKWDEAIGFAEKARNAAPNDPAPGITLVNLYGARQDWTRANALASELATLFPGNGAVADAQGRVLVASGERDAAVDPFRQAYEAAPNSEPLFQRYLGALVAAKRFQEARTVGASAA